MSAVWKQLAVTLVVVLMMALPVTGQEISKPAPKKSAAATPKAPAADGATNLPSGKKLSAAPFRGKLAAVDKTARTISIGKSTYHVSAETKIKRSGAPATLEDAVIGEMVSGYRKPDASGKLVATTLNLGPKAETRKDSK